MQRLIVTLAAAFFAAGALACNVGHDTPGAPAAKAQAKAKPKVKKNGAKAAKKQAAETAAAPQAAPAAPAR